MSKIVIYTDGACQPNPGPGGWAAILTWNGHERIISGGEPDTTNNRMEITAVLKALEAIKGEGRDVDVYTDSQYVRNGMMSWMANWERKGWKTASKKPVMNDDLWKQMIVLCRKHAVNVFWVKGHAGHPMNERCDELAVAAIPQ